MKNRNLYIVLLSSLVAVSAIAAPKKGSQVGEAMRPRKNLEFDGRSIETLRRGNYDSASHLDEGDGAKGAKHLYDLPKDFKVRTAEEQSELRYRQ
jgi:hypothetical protein